MTQTIYSTRVFLAHLLPKSANMPLPQTVQVVKDKVAENKVIVFSKTYCPYCAKAKRAIGAYLQASQYTVIELDIIDNGEDIQDALLEITGGRSVPRVFIDGAFFGGGDDTVRKAESGELKELLVQAGVLTA